MKSCKDCLHYEVCEHWADITNHAYYQYGSDCSNFKDKNQTVDLSCKKGDTLYVLTSDSLTGIEKTVCKRIKLKFLQDAVSAIVIAPCVNDDWGGAIWEFDIDDFGKKVFLTLEEAEKALKELKYKK